MTYYTALDVSLRSISICIVDDRGRAIRSEGPGDLENELRGLLRVFGVVLASKVPHGAYDAVVREQIQAEPLLGRALLPLLDAREVIYRTYLKLDNEVKTIVLAVIMHKMWMDGTEFRWSAEPA